MSPEDKILMHWRAASLVSRAPAGEFSKPRSLLEYYGRELEDRQEEPLVMVEVGVFRGQFLETLANHCPNAEIIGIDSDVQRVRIANPRISVARGDQHNADELAATLDELAPNGFDMLFDDASHVGSLSHNLFGVAIKRLRSGGCYYIEGWQTGYVETWPDGHAFEAPRFEGQTPDGFAARLLSHDFGMIGFIKSLIDFVAADGETRLAEISITPGVCKLVKV